MRSGKTLERLLAVWALLLASRLLAPGVGEGGAALLAFSAAVWVVWRGGRLRLAPPGEGALRVAAQAVLGVVAGHALFGPWLLLAWHAGREVGLPLSSLGAPLAPAAGGPALWCAGLVLAPLFEEGLYRGHVLAVLRARLGAPAALALSSALFAIPHAAPWTVLGTFLGGLGLGALALASRGLALPIGVHAGLNLGAVLGGVPPVRLVPPVELAALLGALALLAALGLVRPARVAVRAPVLGNVP